MDVKIRDEGAVRNKAIYLAPSVVIDELTRQPTIRRANTSITNAT
ncbi:uncharacterized protein BCN122_I1078 [Burkholderia cenocepacia]|nr:uncharacterized protein BCN122_I1078 [Burkholderia cenocepacia]